MDDGSAFRGIWNGESAKALRCSTTSKSDFSKKCQYSQNDFSKKCQYSQNDFSKKYQYRKNEFSKTYQYSKNDFSKTYQYGGVQPHHYRLPMLQLAVCPGLRATREEGGYLSGGTIGRQFVRD